VILVAPGYLGGYVSGVPWQEEEENESEDDRVIVTACISVVRFREEMLVVKVAC